MTEKKSGPVKPPIIDATARQSEKDKPAPQDTAAQTPKASQKPEPAPLKSGSASKSEAKPTSGSSAKTERPDDTPKPSATAPNTDTGPAPKPKQPATKQGPLPFAPLAATAGVGALVGLALAYGLAGFGLWPQQEAPAPDLTQFDARAARLESAIAARAAENEQMADTINALEGQIAGIAPISTDGLAAQDDIDALNTQLSELSNRIEAIAAGASGDEVAEVADTLSGLSSRIDDVAGRIEAIEPEIAQALPALETALSRLDDLDARIANQSQFEAVAAERDRATQIPAALGALETAIASGEPFAAQLATVETLLPDLEISPQVRAAANSGAASAGGLLVQLRAAIPDILAARPRDAQAGWAETLFDQAASAIALRATDGDTPQALVGRTEAALDAGDLAAAKTAFGSLPVDMRNAAPAFAQALDQSIAVESLIDAARSGTAPAEAAQ